MSALADLDGVREVVAGHDLVGPLFTSIDVLRSPPLGAALSCCSPRVMLVANTIRLTALARRKEIEIMRLVGASRLFIALPFLIEALFNALLAWRWRRGTGGVDQVRHDRPSAELPFLPFVGWDDYLFTLWSRDPGPVLTVVPTLLLTRKYLRY